MPLRGKLLSYAKRLLNDPAEAEDVVQDTYLKLWFMRAELDKYISVMALSTQITKHFCLNKLRERQREYEELNSVTVECPTPNPDAALEQKESVSHLMRIIDRLPESQQAVLKMKHIDGYEIEEIAAITGSAPEAIRVNLSRARKKVKELFFKIENR